MVGPEYRKQLLTFILLILLSSCASLQTQVGHYNDIEKNLTSHKYNQAVERIEKAREEGKYKKKDRVIFYLDMGIALHNAGEYERSNRYFEMAERAIEENFTKSISKLATSMLLNDNVLDYAGEDYEDITINILMALNYIHMDNIEDAMVEVRRIDNKLEVLEEKYRNMAEKLSKSDEHDVKFRTGETDLRYSTLGSFISMLSYLHLGKYDDARIDMQRIKKVSPEGIDRLLNNIMENSGKEVPVYPICFAGMGPIKKPLVLSLDLDPGLDLGRITIPGEENPNLTFKYKGDKELHFKFAVPRIKERESRIDNIRILVNGKCHETLHLLEDFNSIAQETFNVKKPIVYLRAGLRTFLKAVADSKAKEKIDEKTEGKDLLGSILKFAVDVATDITENADLRCWRTMTGRAYTGFLYLRPGKYDITLEFTDSRGRVVDRNRIINYQVHKNNLNIIEGVSYR